MTTPDPENPTRVQKATPMDVAAIRDPGMKALVLLAASLGWNIIHKPNNPILLKARDGRERRIPTNTSIRMSVFQANLSTILTHSPGFEPSAGLIDDIVRKTKIDRDHERRLRLSVTELEEVHQARLANIERGARTDISHEEHLTQRVEMPHLEEQEEQLEAAGLRVDPELEPGELSFFGPFDGQDHGKLISRLPYMATYHSSRKRAGIKYASETSYERVWEDGYKDYECMVCGVVKGTPQAVGSHKQIHVKAGIIEASPPSAVMSRTKGVPIPYPSTSPLVAEPAAPAAVPPPEPTPSRLEKSTSIQRVEDIGPSSDAVLMAITELIAPNLSRLLDETRRKLEDMRAMRDEWQNKYKALEANWNALRDLVK